MSTGTIFALMFLSQCLESGEKVCLRDENTVNKSGEITHIVLKTPVPAPATTPVGP
jgi:hypothetical protein